MKYLYDYGIYGDKILGANINEWKLFIACLEIADYILPYKSKRRQAAKFVFSGFYKLYKIVLKILQKEKNNDKILKKL